MFKEFPKFFQEFAKNLMTSAFVSGCGSFGFALSDKKSIIFNSYKLDREDGDDNWLSITDIENGTTIKLSDDELMSLSNALRNINQFQDDFNSKDFS